MVTFLLSSQSSGWVGKQTDTCNECDGRNESHMCFGRMDYCQDSFGSKWQKTQHSLNKRENSLINISRRSRRRFWFKHSYIHGLRNSVRTVFPVFFSFMLTFFLNVARMDQAAVVLHIIHLGKKETRCFSVKMISLCWLGSYAHSKQPGEMEPSCWPGVGQMLHLELKKWDSPHSNNIDCRGGFFGDMQK